MNEKQIIKQALKSRNMSQADLAEVTSFKSQSNINGLLNRGKAGGMSVGNVVELLAGMNYSVEVVDNNDPTHKWVLDMDKTPSDPTGWLIVKDGEYRCPICGAVSTTPSKFCPNCGHKFKKYDN